MRDSKQELLHFWFVETGPRQWFQQDELFDGVVRGRFGPLYETAAEGLCDDWAKDAEGCVALILLLHQIPRTIYRHAPRAYATDPRALLIAKQAVARGFDQMLTPVQRRFIYLPFMESEQRANQRRSVELFARMQRDDPLSYQHARRNFRIIDKFGRFPQRNTHLGREMTPEEREYLAGGPLFMQAGREEEVA